jgi:hypothetical protein
MSPEQGVDFYNRVRSESNVIGTLAFGDTRTKNRGSARRLLFYGTKREQVPNTGRARVWVASIEISPGELLESRSALSSTSD